MFRWKYCTIHRVEIKRKKESVWHVRQERKNTINASVEIISRPASGITVRYCSGRMGLLFKMSLINSTILSVALRTAAVAPETTIRP